MAPDLPILVVWGASGHAKVVADTARLAGFRVAWFIDDDPARTKATFEDCPVLLGPAGLAQASAERAQVAIGVGDNAPRARIHARIAAAGLTLPPLVHPSAVVARGVRIGDGTVVAAKAVLNPGTSLGLCVIINSAAVVEHDCTVDDFSHVSPGAVLTGGVTVGRSAHIGAGAVILPGVTIGANAVVGAGAVVTHDVAPEVVVVGVPARLRSYVGEQR
jgi:sugar O-acyltransferase (sialic acid O-acetyltransferase NeuD family)